MSAIFGFTGPPDPQRLQHMGQILAHRGKDLGLAYESTLGSLAYSRSNRESPWEKGAGVLALPDLKIALAGMVLNTAEFLEKHPHGGEELTPMSLKTSGTPYQDPSPHDLLPALARAYREQGPGFAAELRGAFVLAILDGEQLILIRDVAGARTLFHARIGNRICFAVEPKGIWCLPDFARHLAPASLARYLAFSFQPGPETMLQGLEEVEPGTWVGYQEGQRHSQRYLCLEHEEEIHPKNSDLQPWIDSFRQTLGLAIRERLPHNRPVAAFLSGGIDSSAVVAELAAQQIGKVHTFAVHFGEKYPSELSFAHMVARQCGTVHEDVLVRPKDFLTRLRQIVWHLDDPIGDPVAMPNFELARRVGEKFPVVFNGEGGDPCFGGPKNIPMMMNHWYGLPGRRPGFLERWYLASYRRCYEEIPRLLTPELRARFDQTRDLEAVLTPFFAAAEPKLMLHKLTTINMRLKGAHLILPKVERMLGAHGTLPLSPLFDERLMALSYRLPAQLLLHKGVEKIVLKEAYRQALPEQVIARPKSGMRVPVNFWFRGELARYARKILSKKALARTGIFDAERVDQLRRYETEEGRGRYGIRLWMLLTFEIWRRLVIEGEKL